VLPRDTTTTAHQAQLVALRKLGPGGRMRLAAQMSEDVRQIAIAGELRRHPEYTLLEARKAVLDAAWGEPLASRVWAKWPRR